MKRKIYNITTILLIILTLYSCALQADATDQIEVLAHRGACFLAPENTIPAAELALAHGADWIEIDVRESSDGVMFNFHDATLERTTNGEGEIVKTHSNDILKLDAGSWFSEEFVETRVPTVSEMLDTLKGRSKVFFDVKRGTSIDNLVTLVREKGFENECFFWFADSLALIKLVEVAPHMAVKVNAKSVDAVKRWQQVCRPTIIETAPSYITDELREYCHSNTISIMAAIKQSTPESYREALDRTPDIVNLDAPELWQQIIKEQR